MSLEKFIFEDSSFFTAEVANVLKMTAIGMPNWKWCVIAIILTAGILLRPLLQMLLKEIKRHNPFSKKFPQSFMAFFLSLEIERPISWLFTIMIWFAVGDAIGLAGKIQTYYEHILRGLVAIYAIRLFYYAVDAGGSVLQKMAEKTASTYDDQLVPFATKSAKVFVIVMGVLIALQNFGINVMSILAGLGLGGLALALAAQDTAANLFGSITILFDHPFKVGDLIKIKDMEGTVEDIGFRSTRIRTGYNSVISIPNAMMAKETIDNMGIRPFRRTRQILGLAYETPPEKIDLFCDQVRYLVTRHPKVNPETVLCRFNNYSASSLDVLMVFHLEVFTAAEEMEHQQGIFLEILKIAADLGVEFAYPTQTIYNKFPTAPPAEKPKQPETVS